MARNIRDLRKLHDYTKVSEAELIEQDNKEILKRNKIAQEKKGISNLVEVKIGLGFLENFKIILDTRHNSQRNLFLLMIFILWIEFMLNGIIVHSQLKRTSS